MPDIADNLSEENYDLVNKFIKITGIPSLDLGFYGDVSLNMFNNYAKVSFKQINPNYKTHGNPYLATDIKRIEIYDRLRLLNNQLFFTYQGQFQSNNVKKDSISTNERKTSSFGLTYYPNNSLPSVTARMGSTDQTIDESLIPEQLLSNPSFLRQFGNNSSNLNIDINHKMVIANIDNSITFSRGSSKLEYDDTTLSEVETSGNTFSIRSNFGFLPLRTFVQYSNYESLSNVTLNTNDFSLRGEYDLGLLGSELSAYSQMVLKTTELTDSELKQSSFEFGGRYRLPISETHTFSAIANFRTVSYSGSGDFSSSYLNLGAEYSF
jgi:hypothetical protein